MINLENISYNTYGIYFLIFVVILIIIFFISKKIKPSYTLPGNKIKIGKYLLEKTIIYLLIITILLIPLNIKFVKDKKIIKIKSLNIQILFDVSLSMTADDIPPSRFDAAKQSVIELIKNLEGYNFSIITFSGIPFVYAPFSDDTDAIIDKLENTKITDFPPTINFVGTAIGDSILLGTKKLIDIASKKSKAGLIILITDGDSNRGAEPLDAAAVAKKSNIPIYTLGVGEEDYVIGTDNFGNTVTTNINISLLKQISQNTDGTFYRVLSKQKFDEIFEQISHYVKSQEKEIINYEYYNLNNYLYKITIFLIFIYILIRLYILNKFRNKN